MTQTDSSNHLSPPPFARVIWKMIALTFHTSPLAYLLFITTSLVFTALLIADLHLVRVLLDDLPLFAGGEIAYRTVLLTVLLLGGINIIDTLMNATANMLYEYLAKRTTGRMTEAMGEKAGRLGLIRFESAELYDTIEKAANGRQAGFEAMEEVIFSFIFHGGYFFFLGLYLIRIEPILVLGISISFLPVALSRYIRASAFYRTEHDIALLRREFRHYEECLTDRVYFKETRTLRAVPFFRRLYDRVLAEYNRRMWQTELRTGFIDLGLKILTLIGYVGLLLLLVHFVIRGRISPGLFGAVYFAMDNIFKWFEELFNRLGSAYEHAGFGGNYLAFMDAPDDRTGSGVAPPLAHISGENDRAGIVLKDVSFRYPGTRTDAIDDVTLTIEPGESVALVGENGAGKSTLVRLIAGLFDPDSGEIHRPEIGSSAELVGEPGQRGVSAVYQQYQRYRLSLRENVSIGDYSRNSGTSEEIRHALDRADLKSVRGSLPEGLDTLLSREFGGMDLSGGEWQRVAIARGLYRIHDLIILDEPTAAIDPLEEAKIYRQFIETAKDTTAIIVTHRLGSARLSDRIIVMKQGKIVEQGSHRQLVDANGEYARLYKNQSAWYSRDGMSS